MASGALKPVCTPLWNDHAKRHHGGLNSVVMRLQHLLDGDTVMAIVVDRVAILSEVVASVGDPHRLAQMRPSAAALVDFFNDAAARGAVAAGQDARVTRCCGIAGSVEQLTICVALAPGIELVFLVSHKVGSQPFKLKQDQAARRIGAWVADYALLWWEVRGGHRRIETMHAALDLIGFAVLVLGADQHDIVSNAAAQSMLAKGDGLRMHEGMLTAAMLPDTARLHGAIAHVRAKSSSNDGADVQSAPLLSIARDGRRPLSVAVMRGFHRSRYDQQSVVIHAIDPEDQIGRIMTPTCEMFCLTAAEARLTALLVAGMSLADAALRLRIQMPTARTYLKQAFAKTGTNRQAALVQVMLTSMVSTEPRVSLAVFR
ncbi:helix-turn-helix transcriptional regulator [Polymorphobacter multimanifer]|uniref:DNA-binding CsgD family transcriptional regulator n=1 Tax=Polymorphobacter multimanifer TaxID=1070431 RepID=A0A841LI29_9SPHN|nr:helix-turn-helix transcriptional regulator [Polymorphobacter multimanifer]MBB6229465.1 DNA-binding CsgD family transcriptional regulator [Polymorphobacter multimanifer]